MRADRFHAPPPCFLWDHPPHVTGKHILHRQHPCVLLLPQAPRGAEHPVRHQPTCPENSRAAVTHLGMAFNWLAHSLVAAIPSSPGLAGDRPTGCP